MAPRSSSPIDDLKAPSGDGEILIWPAPERLARIMDENRRLLTKANVRLLDRPIPEWGVSSRDAPLVFAGHQPAFFHPGVWAKNVVAATLAQRLGGRALFLAVDSDAPDHLALEWPRVKTGRYEIAAAPVLPALQGRCYEQFPLLSSALVDAFAGQMDASITTDASTPLPAFLTAFRKGDSNAPSYVSSWSAGMNALDRAVDAPAPAIDCICNRFAVGRPSVDRSAVALIAHLLLNAGPFALAYNGALKSYRNARGIKSDRHPIPDLLIADGKIELPFWVLIPSGLRQRLFVSNDRDAVELWAGAESIGTVTREMMMSDSLAALRDNLGSPQIRPRALALTIYARLLACDLFIHGIGGAKYDQIADDVIRHFFGMEPPGYACASATLRLPLRRQSVTQADYEESLHRVRDLRYNPQRYLDGGAEPTSFTGLMTQRERAITESNRLRSQSPSDHSARRAAYHAIQRTNGTILTAAAGLFEHFQQETARISEALLESRIVDNREWFTGIYPLSKLADLRDALVRNVV